MPKASANTATDPAEDVADSNEAGPRVIAEWVGDDHNPRMKGFSARVITKKQAKESLLMELTRDLRWGKETAYRADVTDESEPFKDWLREAKEFKVTEE